MISLEDCIALCGLTEEEIAAIAEHEHIPDLAALTVGQYLLHQEQGPEQIRQMIVDDLRAALRAGDKEHAGELFSALRHLVETHPDLGRAERVQRAGRLNGGSKAQ